MRFRSFQSRLLVLFVGLFAAVLVATLLVVNAANTTSARTQIDDTLEVGSKVFHQLLEDRTAQLLQSARLLSADFGFKDAYATAESATIKTALGNFRDRIGADRMLLLSLDYDVLADTELLASTGQGELVNSMPFTGDIEAALDEGEFELSTLAFLNETPYQLAIVPLLVPVPDAWICIGFRIDDQFVSELERLTLAEVSLLANSSDGWSALASTLTQEQRQELVRALPQDSERDRSLPIDIAGETFVSLVTSFGDLEKSSVVVVLQRSLAEAMAPFLRLRSVLLFLFFGSLALCLFLGRRVAHSVSRPVLDIADRASRVEEGDYDHQLDIRQEDEIGKLAESFNLMVRGLAERDKVRNLLGKVVSPAIASELMSKDIELGGEERCVSILFSDVRGFTSLCEGASPSIILDRLNRYLSVMSAIVEEQNGVVDKYIGDAIMALFGAPLAIDEHAERAIEAALAMHRALANLNLEFEREGAPAIEIGIGINSDQVVAGNMGSQQRLNYTVIGDGVNLASRLEGLTKIYGVPILISESSQRSAPGIVCREIDRVRVKGKQQAVTIFEPLGREGDVRDRSDALHRHQQALEHYRSQDWKAARAQFTAMAKDGDQKLADLYLERIQRLEESPPPADWDGTFTHQSK